jgi:hypothetical protein
MGTTYKITLSGNTESVEGTQAFTTLEECQAWLDANQVYYAEGEEGKPATDSSKYILFTTESE